MTLPAYRLRPAGPGDLSDVMALRTLAGPGFTSLAVDDALLAERLALSQQSFAATPAAPGKERYLLALEHLPEGRVVGIAGIKACVGEAPPFFNFRILRIAQASAAAQRRFDLEVLILVNEFARCTEVGSLFLRADHRTGGVGRALAQTRYLLMAMEPQRFCDRVVSELRGVVGADGVSPFWEALGRHFFRMDFDAADRLSATSDSQFILDLMPKYPIYVDLLPAAARAVIGQTHPEGAGARRLLEWEGFAFTDVVDIFDAGPLLTAPRDGIRTAREARHVRLVAAEPIDPGARALIAVGQGLSFRCVPAPARIHGEEAVVSGRTLELLGVAPGAAALVWSEAAA